MQFIKSDWDWSGELTAERKERLRLVVQEINRRASELAKPHGIRAEVMPGIFSTGVQGDERTYTPVVNLILPLQKFDHNLIEQLKSEISSKLPVNRVTFEITA